MPDARTLYREGFQHYIGGELDAAVALYREALGLDDSLALAWNGLSIALGRLGQLDEAIEAGHRLIALEPDDPLSHTNLSRLLQQKGLIPEAEDEKAIAMNLQMKQQS